MINYENLIEDIGLTQPPNQSRADKSPFYYSDVDILCNSREIKDIIINRMREFELNPHKVFVAARVHPEHVNKWLVYKRTSSSLVCQLDVINICKVLNIDVKVHINVQQSLKEGMLEYLQQDVKEEEIQATERIYHKNLITKTKYYDYKKTNSEKQFYSARSRKKGYKKRTGRKKAS